jgi:hypothetical protein
MRERSELGNKNGGKQAMPAQPTALAVFAAFTALAVLIAPTCMMSAARPRQTSAEICVTVSRCSSVRMGPSPVVPAIQKPFAP